MIVNKPKDNPMNAANPPRSERPKPTRTRRSAAAGVKSARRRANVLCVKTPVSENSPTVVEAQVDVGFGNILFIRGEGGGLSWEQGVALRCIAPAAWAWSTETASGPLVFKLLINDQVWSQGEDWRVRTGQQIEVTPVF
jgi:hypothetical protein